MNDAILTDEDMTLDEMTAAAILDGKICYAKTTERRDSQMRGAPKRKRLRVQTTPARIVI